MLRKLAAAAVVAALALAQPYALGAPKKNPDKKAHGKDSKPGDRKKRPRKPPAPPTSAVAPVRLIAEGNDRIAVSDLHSFFDTVEIGSASDGLFVVNRLPLERYVLGLNEVPPDWPMEALRAQAVAARTYALHTLGLPPSGEAARYGFDICATILCQVFSGADVVALDDGPRWVEAVQSTAGKAILYQGAPILARYHSVSGGVTFDNEDAFPGEPPYPYLKSVASPDEEASPLFRWEVTFSVHDVQAMLVRAGWWSVQANGKLVSARTLPSASGSPYPDIRFRGKKGSIRRFGDDFRTIARGLAPGMFPGRYPSPAATSSGRLPETLPSERFRVVTTGDTVHFYGRGWGHGVGMSQWGAYGLALRGWTFEQILSHYYTGVSVGSTGYSGPIRVGVATGLSSVGATGRFEIVDGRGKTLVKNAYGTWGFSYTGGDTVAIAPGQTGPSGGPDKRLPLSDSSLGVAILKSPRTVPVGGSAFLYVRLTRPARVSTVTATAGEFDALNEELKTEGRSKVIWLAPLDPGKYEVRVEARAGEVARRSRPVTIRVHGSKPPVSKPVAKGKPLELAGDEVSPFLLGTALGLLLIVGFAVFTGTIRRWPALRRSKTRLEKPSS